MKIAIFIDDYLPSVHGVATSTYMYKEALAALGHEVYIIALSRQNMVITLIMTIT